MKIPSLIDLFNEYDLSIVLITETWIKHNIDRIKEDLNLNYGLEIIYYNGPGTKRGGGVAIVYNPLKMKLEENKFARNGLEIVSAKGKNTRRQSNFCLL